MKITLEGTMEEIDEWARERAAQSLQGLVGAGTPHRPEEPAQERVGAPPADGVVSFSSMDEFRAWMFKYGSCRCNSYEEHYAGPCRG